MSTQHPDLTDRIAADMARTVARQLRRVSFQFQATGGIYYVTRNLPDGVTEAQLLAEAEKAGRVAAKRANATTAILCGIQAPVR